MKQKITNEVIDAKLNGRSIKRIGDYKQGHVPIKWLCSISTCSYMWNATPHNIIHGKSGCPKCAGSIRLTNDIIDERLIDRDIKRLSDIINGHTGIDFVCLICAWIWNASPTSIISGKKSGCPRCAGCLKLTNEIIDKRLYALPLKRIGNCIDSTTKIQFQCLSDTCAHIWSATPNNILFNKSTCPKCANRIPLNNEMIDERLLNRDIKRIGDYLGHKDIKIDWQCLCCNDIWNATPGHVLNSESGCPNCKTGKNERLVYSVLVKHNIVPLRRKYSIDLFGVGTSKMFIDFYFPETKIAIEYNGEQHYKPTIFGNITQEEADAAFIRQQERDIYLQNLCDYNNIELIWIDGRKYTNSKLEKYVIETIIPKLRINK